MQIVVQAHRLPSSATSELDAAAKHLAKYLRGRLHDIDLFVRQGGVVLRGVANSYYVKQLAEHAVMRRVSLPIVANEIVVPDVATASRMARSIAR